MAITEGNGVLEKSRWWIGGSRLLLRVARLRDVEGRRSDGDGDGDEAVQGRVVCKEEESVKMKNLFCRDSGGVIEWGAQAPLADSARTAAQLRSP